MTAAAVPALVDEVEAEAERLVERVAARIRHEVPGFVRVPASTLERAIHGNLMRALAALRELREPTPEELELAAAVGRERAEQGLSLDAVLHAYRVTVSTVWARMGERAREHGVDVAAVLAFSEALWVWADRVMDAVGAAHREVELQLARAEQQRRDAFVLAVLLGTIDAAELSRDRAEHGVDPEREYVPFRARPADEVGEPGGRVLARALGGERGLVTSLDHDLAGLAPARPAAIAGVAIGVGPPCRLASLPGSFAMAGRALQTALAFGQEGVLSLADLSIRPAILTDEALGDAFVGRYLEPLTALGRLGTELEATLRAWFDREMRIEETARALHLHPNTLRHRLRRFEETTGASLKRPADLVELWWALERRRLSVGG
jgi:hypothetical protein